MKSLFDIMQRKNTAVSNSSESLAVTTQIGIKTASIAVLGATIGETAASKFADGASKLVTDKKFLGELEGEIGLPKENETEDEFVARAKSAMFKMLKKKLS